ncbi:MAG: hypothetical protein P4K93_05220 [Terracidiphilus sp.]|nr:hypothetical protein [Terracidiphilus sp.]MDR3797527.1 hypothetical protein [Terracidiphilus sp.]
MSRPTGITVSALLIALVIVSFLVRLYTSSPAPSMRLQAHSWVTQLLVALLVYFYWSAHNWARILILIVSVLYVSDPLFWSLVYFHQIHNLPFDAFSKLTTGDIAFSFGKALLGIYLLWYLNTRAIRDWFEQRAVPPEPISN